MLYCHIKGGLSHEDIPSILYCFLRILWIDNSVKFPIESFVELNVTINLYKIVTHGGVIAKQTNGQFY